MNIKARFVGFKAYCDFGDWPALMAVFLYYGITRLRAPCNCLLLVVSFCTVVLGWRWEAYGKIAAFPASNLGSGVH